MRVLMVSKALVVGAYRRKLELLASRPDVDLSCVVPPAWGTQALERLHVRGYRLIVQPIRFNGNFHLFYFPTLGRLLRSLRPDLVHVDEEPYNLATFLAVRQALSVGSRPIFFTWQNLHRRYPPPFRWFERYVFHRARHAIAGTSEAARVLRRKGYAGPLAVIPQFGVDPEIFTPPATRTPNASFTIGYAGRFVEEKGLFVLLDAVAGLAGDWRLRLLGDGPLRAALVTRARALGLADRVAVETSVPSIDMPAGLAGLDALVLPSLTRPNWKEQFGRVLIEAMACGVPVVGSTSGEIPHVVGDAGLLIPEAHHVALRAALRRLATEPPLRVDLGRRGRARVLERFTHQRIADQTLAVYRRVVQM
jgi:glycosyltransferase involved in cell wall biosynthesis